MKPEDLPPTIRKLNPWLFGENTERTIDANAVTDESELHDEIIEYCKDRRWIYFHGSMAHATKRTKGEPDFIILADRRVFFIECKSKTGKPSTEQLGVIQWAATLGHTIHVVTSMDQFRRIVQ